jgi:hypothetical protein
MFHRCPASAVRLEFNFDVQHRQHGGVAFNCASTRVAAGDAPPQEPSRASQHFEPHRIRKPSEYAHAVTVIVRRPTRWSVREVVNRVEYLGPKGIRRHRVPFLVPVKRLSNEGGQHGRSCMPGWQCCARGRLLTPPSSGHPKARCAAFGLPLMSNVRRRTHRFGGSRI